MTESPSDFTRGLLRAEEIVRGEIQRLQDRQRKNYIGARAEAINKLWRCARRIRETVKENS